MNTYEELQKRQQAEFNALPLGYAFTNEQFAKMMEGWGLDPKTDIDKVSCTDSFFFQKKDREQIVQTFRRHKAELKEGIAADQTGDGFIYAMFYTEMVNHECGYTGDYDDALAAVGLTWEQVMSDPRLKHGFEKAQSKTAC